MKRETTKEAYLNSELVLWRSKTTGYEIVCTITKDIDYKHQNDVFVTFDAEIAIWDKFNDVIGASYMGGCIYRHDDIKSFIATRHFREMLAESCNDARQWMAGLPKLRRVLPRFPARKNHNQKD